MESFPLNVTDMVVLAVILVSAALAFARGFVHEVLAISGWIIGYFGAKALGPMVEPFVATILNTFPSAKKFVEENLSLEMVISLGALILTFAVILIICSIIAHLIAGRIRASALNAVDRSLGFAFGLARGALIVCLAYLLATWVWADEQPPWLKDAKSRPLLASGADYLKELAPQGLDLSQDKKKDKDKAKKKDQDQKQESAPQETLPQEAPQNVPAETTP